MRDKKTFLPRPGIGASSVMLIVLVVCLALFGTLGLVTARGDRELTDRTTAAVVSRYDADLKAQQLIAKLDLMLLQAYDDTEVGSGASALGAEYDPGSGCIFFSVALDGGGELSVVLSDIEPGAAADRYAIKSYKRVAG